MVSFINQDQSSTSAGLNHFLEDFKTRTKTHRLFGLWVAELLGLSPQNSEQYVEKLLMLDLFEGNEISLLEQAHDDLLEKNIFISESHLQHQMDYFWDMATNQEKKPS